MTYSRHLLFINEPFIQFLKFVHLLGNSTTFWHYSKALFIVRACSFTLFQVEMTKRLVYLASGIDIVRALDKTIGTTTENWNLNLVVIVINNIHILNRFALSWKITNYILHLAAWTYLNARRSCSEKTVSDLYFSSITNTYCSVRINISSATVISAFLFFLK